MASKNLIKVKDLSKELGMSESWIYTNLEAIPHYRLCGTIRFDLKEVLEWVESQKSAGKEN